MEPDQAAGASAPLFAGRYWPEAGVESAAFRARFPHRRRLLRMARLAVRRRIRHWHPWHMEKTHVSHRLGDPIDWFIPPDGDHEWIESLVRFYHMIDLAAAFRITGRRRFLQAFESYLHSFNQVRGQPGRHWHYKLNPAIRVMNLVRAWDLIQHHPQVPSGLAAAVGQSLRADIEFLLPRVDESIGNGAFFVTTGLLAAAELFGEGAEPARARWRQVALSKLEEILQAAFHADGVEVEQAPLYHGEVLLTLLDVAVALQSNARPLPAGLEARAREMLQVLVQLQDPDGRIPPVGDSDRFRVAYLCDLFRAVLGAPPPCRVVPPKAAMGLQTFPATGWAVARWRGTAGREGWLLFDCASRPPAALAGHSHADALQVLLHDGLGPLLVDPGRFTYCTAFKAYLPFTRRRLHPEGRFRALYRLLFPRFMALAGRDWRDHFRRTLAHNTVSPHGRNQSGVLDPKQAPARVALVAARAQGAQVQLEGLLEDPGTSTAPGYRHRRALVGLSDGLWLVLDRLECEVAQPWLASWHLETGVRAVPREGYWQLRRAGVRHRCWLLSDDPQPTVRREQDWVSPVYNRKQPAQVLQLRTAPRRQVWLVTVVQLDAPGAPMVRHVRLRSASVDALEVELARERGRLLRLCWRPSHTRAPSVPELHVEPES